MTRTRAAVVTGLAAVLLASGCSPDAPEPPDAAPSDESSTSATASPSPSATNVVVAPERPSDMNDDGPAGAEAAATYFLQLDDYIMKTGDTTEWEAMSHKECGFCESRLDQAREVAEGDYTWGGGDTQVEILHTYEQDAATGIWPIDIDASVSAVEVTGPSGEEVFSNSAVVDEFRVEVARKKGSWVIVGVGDRPES